MASWFLCCVIFFISSCDGYLQSLCTSTAEHSFQPPGFPIFSTIPPGFIQMYSFASLSLTYHTVPKRGKWSGSPLNDILPIRQSGMTKLICSLLSMVNSALSITWDISPFGRIRIFCFFQVIHSSTQPSTDVFILTDSVHP